MPNRDGGRSIITVDQTMVQIRPTLGTGVAYVSGDVAGTTIVGVPDVTRFDARRSFTIQRAFFHDLADATAIDWRVLLFDRLVTVAADNAALAMSRTDAQYCRGVIKFTGTNFFDIGTGKVCESDAFPQGNLPIVLSDTDADGDPTDDRTLYAVVVAGGGYTAVAADDILIDLYVAKD